MPNLTTITTVRLGSPGAGIMGRVSNTPGPWQLMSADQVKASFGFLQANDKINYAGAADTATKLAAARNIAITGDLTWNVNFDGSTNVTAAGTLATVNTSPGTYTNATVTVNAKGLVTSASNGAAPQVWAPVLNGDTIYPFPLVDALGQPILAEIQ